MSPGATFSAATRAANASTNRSWMPACTYSRLVQTQVWPWLRNLAKTAPATARSRSASSNTMQGALPPSSIDTRFTVPAHCASSCLPMAVDPVKVILRTLSLSVSAPPISRADPVTMLTTPAGTPACSAIQPHTNPDSGVAVAGLTTVVHPAASAGPILRASIEDGKFHGVIAPTTPTGCLVTIIRRPFTADGMISP